MVDAHGSLDVSTAIRLARELEPFDISVVRGANLARRSSWTCRGTPLDCDSDRYWRA